MQEGFQGWRLPSPLIEKDLEKPTRDLKYLTCQVPFYVAFRSIMTKVSNFTKMELEITIA